MNTTSDQSAAQNRGSTEQPPPDSWEEQPISAPIDLSARVSMQNQMPFDTPTSFIKMPSNQQNEGRGFSVMNPFAQKSRQSEDLKEAINAQEEEINHLNVSGRPSLNRSHSEVNKPRPQITNSVEGDVFKAPEPPVQIEGGQFVSPPRQRSQAHRSLMFHQQKSSPSENQVCNISNRFYNQTTPTRVIKEHRAYQITFQQISPPDHKPTSDQLPMKENISQSLESQCNINQAPFDVKQHIFSSPPKSKQCQSPPSSYCQAFSKLDINTNTAGPKHHQMIVGSGSANPSGSTLNHSCAQFSTGREQNMLLSSSNNNNDFISGLHASPMYKHGGLSGFKMTPNGSPDRHRLDYKKQDTAIVSQFNPQIQDHSSTQVNDFLQEVNKFGKQSQYDISLLSPAPQIRAGGNERTTNFGAQNLGNENNSQLPQSNQEKVVFDLGPTGPNYLYGAANNECSGSTLGFKMSKEISARRLFQSPPSSSNSGEKSSNSPSEGGALLGSGMGSGSRFGSTILDRHKSSDPQLYNKNQKHLRCVTKGGTKIYDNRLQDIIIEEPISAIPFNPNQSISNLSFQNNPLESMNVPLDAMVGAATDYLHANEARMHGGFRHLKVDDVHFSPLDHQSQGFVLGQNTGFQQSFTHLENDSLLPSASEQAGMNYQHTCQSNGAQSMNPPNLIHAWHPSAHRGQLIGQPYSGHYGPQQYQGFHNSSYSSCTHQHAQGHTCQSAENSIFNQNVTNQSIVKNYPCAPHGSATFDIPPHQRPSGHHHMPPHGGRPYPGYPPMHHHPHPRFGFNHKKKNQQNSSAAVIQSVEVNNSNIINSHIEVNVCCQHSSYNSENMQNRFVCSHNSVQRCGRHFVGKNKDSQRADFQHSESAQGNLPQNLNNFGASNQIQTSTASKIHTLKDQLSHNKKLGNCNNSEKKADSDLKKRLYNQFNSREVMATPSTTCGNQNSTSKSNQKSNLKRRLQEAQTLRLFDNTTGTLINSQPLVNEEQKSEDQFHTPKGPNLFHQNSHLATSSEGEKNGISLLLSTPDQKNDKIKGEGDSEMNLGGKKRNSVLAMSNQSSRVLLNQSDQKSQLYMTAEKMALGTQNGTSTSAKTSCNCKKSKCLKLYCDCFALGVGCGPECKCADCCNTEGNEERNTAMEAIKDRNPHAFKPKIQQDKGVHSKGCHCKKSGCLKKYCECYQSGVACTDRCTCDGCKNCEDRLNSAFKDPEQLEEVMNQDLEFTTQKGLQDDFNMTSKPDSENLNKGPDNQRSNVSPFNMLAFDVEMMSMEGASASKEFFKDISDIKQPTEEQKQESPVKRQIDHQLQEMNQDVSIFQTPNPTKSQQSQRNLRSQKRQPKINSEEAPKEQTMISSVCIQQKVSPQKPQTEIMITPSPTKTTQVDEKCLKESKSPILNLLQSDRKRRALDQVGSSFPTNVQSQGTQQKIQIISEEISAAASAFQIKKAVTNSASAKKVKQQKETVPIPTLAIQNAQQATQDHIVKEEAAVGSGKKQQNTSNVSAKTITSSASKKQQEDVLVENVKDLSHKKQQIQPATQNATPEVSCITTRSKRKQLEAATDSKTTSQR